MNPKFIYFDLDDTLLNHRQAHRKTLLDVHDQFSVFDDIKIDQFLKTYNEINGKQWILYEKGKIGIDQLQHNRFTLTLRQLGLDDSLGDEIGAQYLKSQQIYWQWIEGAEAAFKATRNDCKVGILTNGFAELQKKKFKRLDLYHLADELVISEEVGILKPHPDIFEYATELTGYQPEEILYIGDSYHDDVAGGCNFGWHVGWFTQNGDVEKRNKADFAFSDYKMLMDLIQNSN